MPMPISSTTFLSLLLSLVVAAVVVAAATQSAPSSGHNKNVQQLQLQLKGKAAREFLDEHNKVREQVGTEQPLKWDKAIARYARSWARKQIQDCKMVHSYGPYGENLFWGGRDHWRPAEIVQSWASEREYYDPKTNDCADGKVCGHYTQMVWRDSLRLGCARVTCAKGAGVLAICSYDPPGNFVEESPFSGSGSAGNQTGPQ